MNTSRITIAKLYNLGNYEHVRYEITVDITPGEFASVAFKSLESVISALKPLPYHLTDDAINSMKERLGRLKAMSAVEWEQSGLGNPSNEIGEAESKLAEATKEAQAAKQTRAAAIASLDNLGGNPVPVPVPGYEHNDDH